LISWVAARPVAIFHGNHFDVDVDMNHQGAGDLRSVSLNLWNRAGAFLCGVTVIAAGARVRLQETAAPDEALILTYLSLRILF